MIATHCIHCGALLIPPDAPSCSQCGKSQNETAPVQQEHAGVPPGATIAPRIPATLQLPALTRVAERIREERSEAGQPVLIIQDEGEWRQVPLGMDAVQVGRAPDNDIVLKSRFVSAYHAKIEFENGIHRIVDIGSMNGLLAKGRRIPPHTPLPLADGDVIRIGDRTTGSFVSLIYRNPRIRPARTGPVVRSYPLDSTAERITIGREGTDIVLDNPQVSRRHAVIESLNGVRILRDLGSTNGTFANRKRITQYTLRPGDVIRIAAFKLVYNGDRLDEYDERGALRIDARHLKRAVQRGGRARSILNDVSLSIAPREFVAIVGGSGTGKSTLLNALAGYAPAPHGQVLVNGDDFYRNFDAYRSLLGYVPQDDIIHSTLSVQRALSYAARLRLPNDTSRADIRKRIDRVLEDVEMTAHRNTTVENLSGGQRKRVSIAAELLADPSLFFLDEPTSGLDPGLEKKMMSTLRTLADSGRTVVLVTHATANIRECDLVAFMADGRLVYFGPPGDALPFFNSDDFADIYTKLDGYADPRSAGHWEVVQRDLLKEYTDWTANNPKATQPVRLAELWERRFRASRQYAIYVAERLADASADALADRAAGAAHNRPARISSWRQFGILARRYFDLMIQDTRNLFILLLQAPMIGLLLVLVVRADAIVGERAYASEAKKVLFMLATVAVWFGIINAARELVKEAPVYRRERLANLRITPYLFSKVIILSLLVIIQSAVLLGLVGLKVRFPEYGVLLPLGAELFITTLLTSLAGLAMGLMISAFAASPDRAVSIVPLALIPQILFAGVVFSLGDGITLQRLLSWLTISRWAMDAYGTVVNLNDLPLQPGYTRLPFPPPEYTHTPLHLISRWLILLCYMAVCLALTGWRLRQRDRQV